VGTYAGNTRLGRSRVSSYRYPDSPVIGSDVENNFPGPEQVFRVVLSGRVSNFGVVVTRHARGVSVSPRIVFPGDENHLVGVSGLPVNDDPYLPTFGLAEPVAAVIAPAARAYDVVLDTRGRIEAGPFAFHLWINDHTPPSATLLTRTVAAGGSLVVSVHDAGSGVDPSSLRATIDGSTTARPVSYSAGRVSVKLSGLESHGRHTLLLTVSDYQETKNMETFGGVLPNTRVLHAGFTVR
jgi:hypothetical protein